MSEPRQLPVIQQEYTQLCAKAGQIQYQVSVHKKDLEMINETLRDLSLEAVKSNEAAEKAKESEVKENA